MRPVEIGRGAPGEIHTVDYSRVGKRPHFGGHAPGFVPCVCGLNLYPRTDFLRRPARIHLWRFFGAFHLRKSLRETLSANGKLVNASKDQGNRKGRRAGQNGTNGTKYGVERPACPSLQVSTVPGILVRLCPKEKAFRQCKREGIARAIGFRSKSWRRCSPMRTPATLQLAEEANMDPWSAHQRLW